MDAGGRPAGGAAVYPAAAALAGDLAWLVRSLGGRAQLHPVRDGAYDVSVALPDAYPPFRDRAPSVRRRAGPAAPRRTAPASAAPLRPSSTSAANPSSASASGTPATPM